MVSPIRTFDNRRHVLSDHSIDKRTADRIAQRTRELGMNARVVKHAEGKYAVYRTCKLQRVKPGQTGRQKIIHVNQANIAWNRKNPDDPRPPITLQTSLGSIRANSMSIEGPSEMIYQPLAPLSCGARLFVKTKSPVKLDDGCTRLI